MSVIKKLKKGPDLARRHVGESLSPSVQPAEAGAVKEANRRMEQRLEEGVLCGQCVVQYAHCI